ncbi:MAG: hypothetical protein WD906_09000 [Anaerolineales bacterium]
MAQRSRSTRASKAFVPPYPPSWFDRLTEAIERLPGPYWVPYAIAGAVYLAAVGLSPAPPDPAPFREALFSASLPFYGFWLIHYLNRRASLSLDAFSPAFAGGQAELRDVHWRLTKLPALPALFVSFLALLLGFVSSLDWITTTPAEILGKLAYLATTVFGGLYAYHAIRQLRLVTELYAHRARIDLHTVAPLYSFSTLSAHTAIGMLFLLSAAVLITPSGLTGPFLVGAFAFGTLAVLIFLLPLAGLHRRLVEVKEAELLGNGRRWQACMAELYRGIDRGNPRTSDRINNSLAALERGRAAIERVPTWPWRPETLRGVVGALALPIMIWLIQFALQRVLG